MLSTKYRNASPTKTSRTGRPPTSTMRARYPSPPRLRAPLSQNRPEFALKGMGDVTALDSALDDHGVVLLVFFVRRALDAEAGIALWAETVACAHAAGRHMRARS